MTLLNRLLPGVELEMESAHTIHPRAVSGRFQRLRWACVFLTQVVFYGLPWLTWNGHPAVLLDLPARRFFIGPAVFFPQDMILLTGLLIGCALLLFWATALAGRVWCGFSCPQTVYTELFLALEHAIEGDRRARLQLDAAPWRRAKTLRRGGKHAAWMLLSLWTGLTFAGYFTPMRELVAALWSGPWPPAPSMTAGAYALFTYLNAGLLREKVCQHMCPYARFQGALMDSSTLVVGYDAARGEPRRRGIRRSVMWVNATSEHGNEAHPGPSRGACVDCTLCVQVCPVGIDIREGVQAACIHCGACIDACDPVMQRTGQAPGLIRFASEHAQQGLDAPPASGRPSQNRAPRSWWQRPRVMTYSLLLLTSWVALASGLIWRPTLRLDAMRDRSVMAREVTDDLGQSQTENLYRLQIINASRHPRTVTLHAESLGQDMPRPEIVDNAVVRLAPAETRQLIVRLRVPTEEAHHLRSAHGSIWPILLRVTDPGQTAATATAPSDMPESAETPSTLLLPL